MVDPLVLCWWRLANQWNSLVMTRTYWVSNPILIYFMILRMIYVSWWSKTKGRCTIMKRVERSYWLTLWDRERTIMTVCCRWSRRWTLNLMIRSRSAMIFSRMVHLATTISMWTITIWLVIWSRTWFSRMVNYQWSVESQSQLRQQIYPWEVKITN